MANSVYARRYAQAVFRMAQESQELSRWQSDLRKIAGMCRDEALFALLENREVFFEEKERVLSERLGEIHPMALKLVSMLVAKGRLAIVEYISDEYQQLLDGYRGVEGTGVAEVITAIPLETPSLVPLLIRMVLNQPEGSSPTTFAGSIRCGTSNFISSSFRRRWQANSDSRYRLFSISALASTPLSRSHSSRTPTK